MCSLHSAHLFLFNVHPHGMARVHSGLSPLLPDGTTDKLKSLGVKIGIRMHLIPDLASISAFHA